MLTGDECSQENPKHPAHEVSFIAPIKLSLPLPLPLSPAPNVYLMEFSSFSSLFLAYPLSFSLSLSPLARKVLETESLLRTIQERKGERARARTRERERERSSPYRTRERERERERASEREREKLEY
jgi:hypothetical protein